MGIDFVIMKRSAARRAIDLVPKVGVIGVGSGSTVNLFIEELAVNNFRELKCVSSSSETTKKLTEVGLEVIELDGVMPIDKYFDGADEINLKGEMIKGGGGALTREKLIASASSNFICMIDQFKFVDRLGRFPLALEVLPVANSFVCREIAKLGATIELRNNFTTDNGNIILDVKNLDLDNPIYIEKFLNNIPGVVSNGIFSLRRCDMLIVGHEDRAETHFF